MIIHLFDGGYDNARTRVMDDSSNHSLCGIRDDGLAVALLYASHEYVRYSNGHVVCNACLSVFNTHNDIRRNHDALVR